VVIQIWVFLWTLNSHTLGISLYVVLLGNDFFPDLWKSVTSGGIYVPHGGIYFVFLVTLIGFFIIRNSYRLAQLGKANDKSHQVATSLSMAAIVLPLGYISILAFAHFIYPYIPYNKGGGDYTECPSVSLTFNAMTATNNLFSIPFELSSTNVSNRLIMLDENGSFVFLAVRTNAGGPVSWRAEFLDQLPADVEGVGAAQAGSDQNGDQFGGTQCHRAVFNEPLAGSFACGLVFETVGVNVRTERSR